MSPEEHYSWAEANQRFLVSAISETRVLLRRHAIRTSGEDAREGSPAVNEQDLANHTWDIPDQLPALEVVCRMFGLSAFERRILVVCAGAELDSGIPSLCAEAAGDPKLAAPTFSLALAAFPEAHWSALAPEGPLRKWKLIEAMPSESLVHARLRIDEHILHFLAGLPFRDDALSGIVEDVQPGFLLAPSQIAVAERIIAAWTSKNGKNAAPMIHLCGGEFRTKCAVAGLAAEHFGLTPLSIRAGSLPVNPLERTQLARLVERTAYLSRCIMVLDADDLDDSLISQTVLPFIDMLHALVVLSSREPVRSGNAVFVRFDVHKPTGPEQVTVWKEVLEGRLQIPAGTFERIVSQYNLNAGSIRTIGEQAVRSGTIAEESEAAAALWNACRVLTRPRLDDLAQRIEATALWDDLVLPPPQKETLRDIARFVRQRFTVHDTWGFAAKSTRGLAISALFSGGSGTGKTMAAEVIANDLRLDLYHIDLSQVVSKYIGETEKNIRRLFDAAEDGGAVLFFDEADALFGKRSEVKDSHDRYANIEVSYLLQRIESYRGLVVLATNMKESLDAAFLRRIQFFVQFPFPDTAARAEIWRHIFPSGTPTQAIDFDRLAAFNIPGGNIRNIALYSAFLAADDGGSVGMNHVLRAAKAEYAKLERPFVAHEIRSKNEHR